MNNKLYVKGDKIRITHAAGRFGKSYYADALSAEEHSLLCYASVKGFASLENDAPRGGKLGFYFDIKKDFSSDEISKMKAADKELLQRKLGRVLKSTSVDYYQTSSDVGAFIINGLTYSNFYGDGVNKVDVCECDKAEFYKSEMLTRRQVFATSEPLTIVKFNSPEKMEIQRSDVEASGEKIVINNALGFCIWSQTLKVFVEKR